ncbi:serine/threonine protein phosphatase 1 [Bradyrhizobium sp. NFR13]|uniref:metallophosphoesterase n=1 Tax=Bradyrhizobium sp. NFR13 TaxID=1566285 RepID=UPI0008EF733B|nr:metallophosphoesterase [Bradyrhizobium sp. NFR13]SFM00383.1 serine/threonine protein phosphatase 1 [Bradyrhizobium sp. NFR13]
MPLTYVIPDLHGRRDLLDLALVRIESHLAGEPATLVLLGDYVDKGPDSRGVIARLRLIHAPALRLAMLKGNHDALMVAVLRGDMAVANWLTKGGDTALASYGGDIADVPVHDIDWLDARPLWHMDEHRIYVHAGVDPALPMAQQDPVLLMTKRYADDDASGHDAGEGARHVVHGHDRHADGPLLKQGRSNFDTYAWKTGRLVIGVFDDALPGGPVELIEITGPPAP